jgi:hypothetical protein
VIVNLSGKFVPRAKYSHTSGYQIVWFSCCCGSKGKGPELRMLVAWWGWLVTLFLHLKDWLAKRDPSRIWPNGSITFLRERCGVFGEKVSTNKSNYWIPGSLGGMLPIIMATSTLSWHQSTNERGMIDMDTNTIFPKPSKDRHVDSWHMSEKKNRAHMILV